MSLVANDNRAGSAVPVITGATRLYGIVGDPIAQAKSPEIYNRILHAEARDAVLVPMHVSAASFEQVLPALMELGNLDGLVVTLPFKERAMPYATALGSTGRLVGAINALRRELGGGWAGDMFDGMGLVGVARDLGTDFAGASVQLVGAGGAGQAIAFSLAQQGIGRLTVTDLDGAKVENLVHRLAAEYPACEASAGLADLAGIDLLVNATPVGMKPADDLPLAIDSLTERTRVIDIVPRQDPTPLLAPAAAAGCIHAGGAPMVAAQARAVLTFLRGGTRQTLIPSRGDVMKLVRYGALGAEKPGLIDKDGKLRSLEGVVKDIDSEAISPAGLAKLRGLDPASLPEVAGKQRFGVPVAHVPM
jgi:shikimate dehydrogenase